MSSASALRPFSSLRDVTYSCGSCGYALNLSSANRNTTNITSAEYGKAIKKGVVSFFSIDETRFSHSRCRPYFCPSRRSWFHFRRRTRLLCRKCGSHIGCAYDDPNTPSTPGSAVADWNGVTVVKRYDIRIRALQPSSEEDSGLIMF